MTVERLFDYTDIQELLDKNAEPKFGRRNAAIIIAGSCWGLSSQELSLLDLKTVLANNGELYRIWVLPEHIAQNGEAREIRTEDHLLSFFENYIQLRISYEWGISNLSSFKGLIQKVNFS